jgi:iron(III) transport system substrate-binding protein
VADPEAHVLTGPADATVVVELAEWSVRPAVAEVEAGRIEFEVENKGTEPHELVVLKTDLSADGLVLDKDEPTVDEAASGLLIGEIEEDELPAGASAEGMFDLVPGNYVLFCNIPEHYQKGMQVALKVTAATRVSGKLVVYSGRSESLVGPIIEQFSAAAGIKVEVKYGGTGEIAATILEEGENSPADLFFAQDPGGLGAVAGAGLFDRLPDDVLARVPDWARSPIGLWVGISGRARAVAYNTDKLSEAAFPDSIEGFTDPKWKGKIGWAPTNGSLQAMVTAMRVLWGDERTEEWLKGIQANEPKVYPNNTSVVAAVGTGEIEVGFVNHYYLYQFLQEQGEGFPVRNYHVRGGGPGGMVLVAGAGILKTAKNKENAERFIEFMLSTVAQQYFTSATFEYPLVTGVRIHPLLTPLEQIANPGTDMAALADLQGTQTLMREVGVIP